MSKPAEKDSKPEIPLVDCERALKEGAFVSPCGTEGCQWDGFPESPDYECTEESE